MEDHVIVSGRFFMTQTSDEQNRIQGGSIFKP